MRKTKRYIILSTLILLSICAKAQIEPDPAHWAYGLKKINANTYEVHLQCTIDDGWHIYAQKQTKDFIGTQTKIKLARIPGLNAIGQPVEIGKKDKFVAAEVGITNYEYAEKVDFVQKVNLKPGIKEIKGSITYQTCTHKQCLAEKTIIFSVPIPN